MVNIRDICRLRLGSGLPQRAIGQSLGVSHSTVSRALQRAEMAGLTWPEVGELSDTELQAALYPAPAVPEAAGHLVPDWEQLEAELQKKRGRREVRTTRRYLWDIYCEEAAEAGLEAYGYSQFCYRLSQARSAPAARLTMRFDYEPGEWGMADFSGKTLRLRQRDGSEKDVEILVVSLCYSRMLYVEATPDQTSRSFCMGHRNAFAYFGGVPRQHVIDNLKAGVTRPGRENFILNESYRQLTVHYGAAVTPARVARFEDKGLVEGAVNATQTGILLPLRGVPFFTLAAMNAAIREKLDALNERQMQKHGMSRRELFEAVERSALRPLPAQPWEWSEWLRPRTVEMNGHIQVDKNLYSVPPKLIGQKLAVRQTTHMLEIFLDQGGERVAVHRLKSGVNQYSSLDEHMHDWQRDMKASRGSDYLEWMLSKIREVGPQASSWAERSIASRDFPAQAVRSLRGMLTLVKTYGNDKVNDACAEALARERLTSGFLRDRLKRGGASRPAVADEADSGIPPHPHIRGEEYYRNAGRSLEGGEGREEGEESVKGEKS